MRQRSRGGAFNILPLIFPGVIYHPHRGKNKTYVWRWGNISAITCCCADVRARGVVFRPYVCLYFWVGFSVSCTHLLVLLIVLCTPDQYLPRLPAVHTSILQQLFYTNYYFTTIFHHLLPVIPYLHYYYITLMYSSFTPCVNDIHILHT